MLYFIYLEIIKLNYFFYIDKKILCNVLLWGENCDSKHRKTLNTVTTQRNVMGGAL